MLGAAATVRGERAPQPTGAPAAARAWTVAESLPGGEQRSAELRDRLRRALTLQPPEYQPRTRHFDQGDAPLYTNRLVLESSPYLLQHAHNPVDWYPWGEEAFQAARRLDRPIFLSVGYATCHWCHVMERESFEDPEVAAYLNAHFIPVKVDREERPDVDAVYMEVVVALTGGGGWPMTVVLTPDREPFFGGTYFPPRAGDRGAEAGLLDVLRALVRAYGEERAAVVARAAELTAHLRTAAGPKPAGALPGPELLAQANRLLALQYDTANGGFGGAPKFPQSVRLDFLLRFARRTGDTAARDRAISTLDHMAAGGIRDQLGGGFHRYATDRAWRVPHFEKMLYDNALLAITYLDAFQATGDARHAEVAREALDDVLRELRGERGGFHSATDADSPAPGGHEEEGRFFTWTPAEVEAVLGPDRARLVALRFGVTEAGDLEGRSILRAARTIAEVAAEAKLAPAVVRAELAAARELLRQVRSSRPRPLEDDKVVTSWNGLAISALARATRVLRDPRYAGAAADAAELLLRELVVDGSLKRSWRHGRVGPDAVLEDYAFLIAGLLDLYEATFEARWLAAAVDLQARQIEQFGDPERGGFYFTARGADPLLFRDKPLYDGALPSGNSVAVMNLLRLYAFTTDERHRREAERALAAFAPELAANPLVAPRLLAALDFQLATVKEIVLVRPDASADLGPFLDVLAHTHLPNAVLAVANEAGPEAKQLATLVPWTEEKPARGGAVTAYVCERRVCKLPTTDPKVFARQLEAEAGPARFASDAPSPSPSPSAALRETSGPAAASEGK